MFESGLREGDAEAVAAMCRRLHAARCPTGLPAERFELPFADELRDALAAADGAGAHLGPYGDPLRELVARNRAAIEEKVAEIEELAATCQADPTPLVLTHGEPNQGDVLRDASGRLHLVDWGDLAHGPPERDWTAVAEFGVEDDEKWRELGLYVR